MQLTSNPGSVRSRLGAAACALLAAGIPAAATPQAAQAEGALKWQIDTASLVYGEKGGTKIVEPIFRVSRFFQNGQKLAAKLGFDTMSGASATGAMPSTRVQTYTTPSGNIATTPIGKVPTRAFHDNRFSINLDWEKPWGRLIKTSIGTHASAETDYRSTGLSGVGSVELFNRRTTLSLGGGINRDQVDPVGGTPAGLSASGREENGSHAKDVSDGMVGLGEVITRRWTMQVNVSRSHENGYLTEPYKVVSVIDPESGEESHTLTEKRPTTRNRSSVLTGTVYHFDEDILYASHRYYRDTWGVRSNTVDLRYRHELNDGRWVQPHFRYYRQTQADFFTFGLRDDQRLPNYASSDYRLGPLRSATAGLKVGFPVPSVPGEFTVRGEYIRQWGDGHPNSAIGAQRRLNLYPAMSISTLELGYSVGF
ncbi:MAG: DUF3570 domain-containing protein [Candidatus Eisenbacteria bacterium]